MQKDERVRAPGGWRGATRPGDLKWEEIRWASLFTSLFKPVSSVGCWDLYRDSLGRCGETSFGPFSYVSCLCVVGLVAFSACESSRNPCKMDLRTWHASALWNSSSSTGYSAQLGHSRASPVPEWQITNPFQPRLFSLLSC